MVERWRRTLVSFLLPGVLGTSAAALELSFPFTSVSLGFSFLGGSDIFCLSPLAGGGEDGAPFSTCWSLLAFDDSPESSVVSCFFCVESDEDAMRRNQAQHNIFD